ncbi:MAG: DUF438 domain-containing protein [Spirochaetes bacterium]|nr:DUF438 domain-containing protein [Spirochaetota bacterium]
MSENLQNEEIKQKKLKEIIKKLHDGATVQEVKKEFSALLKNVSAEEISGMENSLIKEGFPPKEIQKLCDVHVEVFKDSLSKQKRQNRLPGHPVHSYIQENKKAAGVLKSIKSLGKKLSKGKTSEQMLNAFRSELELLAKYEKHYARKENQLFPFLEQKGFSGPSKVMWGKHDEIRKVIKEVNSLFSDKKYSDMYSNVKKMISAIKGMIFMEEKILFPTAMRKLTDKDWITIRRGEMEIGYAWITPGNIWDANLTQNMAKEAPAQSPAPKPDNALHLDEGSLTPEIINLIFKNLPMDISYVDENDKVRYYSATDERIFPRSPGIIGRAVQNCHPPGSVHIVEKILESFKKKEKKSAEFWIKMKDMFIHIRYFPLYDDQGEYKGVIEMSQDVAEIRALKGEKRLLDW